MAWRYFDVTYINDKNSIESKFGFSSGSQLISAHSKAEALKKAKKNNPEAKKYIIKESNR